MGFHVMGGIQAPGLTNVIFQLYGTLVFSDNMKEWSRNAKGHVHECIETLCSLKPFDVFVIPNKTFHVMGRIQAPGLTSGKGTLDGQGAASCGLPGVVYPLHQENRPRLMVIDNASHTPVENMFFENSPST